MQDVAAKASLADGSLMKDISYGNENEDGHCKGYQLDELLHKRGHIVRIVDCIGHTLIELCTVGQLDHGAKLEDDTDDNDAVDRVGNNLDNL